jgi:hypothetical protein
MMMIIRCNDCGRLLPIKSPKKIYDPLVVFVDPCNYCMGNRMIEYRYDYSRIAGIIMLTMFYTCLIEWITIGVILLGIIVKTL